MTRADAKAAAFRLSPPTLDVGFVVPRRDDPPSLSYAGTLVGGETGVTLLNPPLSLDPVKLATGLLGLQVLQICSLEAAFKGKLNPD